MYQQISDSAVNETALLIFNRKHVVSLKSDEILSNDNSSITYKIVEGKSHHTVSSGFNYYIMNSVINLNQYDTNLMDPNNDNSAIKPLIEFPNFKSRNNFTPLNSRDVESVFIEYDVRKVFLFAGSMNVHGVLQVKNVSDADCIFGDFTIPQFFLRSKRETRSTTNILSNNINIFQVESVTGGMISMLSSGLSNNIYIYKISNSTSLAFTKLIQIVSKLFNDVSLHKPQESNWIMDTFILVCRGYKKSSLINQKLSLTGSISDIILGEFKYDQIVQEKLALFNIEVYNIIWRMLSILIGIITHPSKKTRNDLYNKVLNYKPNSNDIKTLENFVKNGSNFTIRSVHVMFERKLTDIIPLYLQLSDLTERGSWLEASILDKVPKIKFGGQVKLLLTELQFLQAFVEYLPLKSVGAKDGVIILYVGSAPGLHIPTVMKLLENYNIKWYLFDPIKHCARLQNYARSSKNVVINQRLFNSEKDYNEIAKLKMKTILISDLRSFDNNGGISTLHIVKDMELNMDIIKRIDPILTHLKFRFPFPNDMVGLNTITEQNLPPLKFNVSKTGVKSNKSKSKYLWKVPDGAVMLQSFNEPTSNEMRLWIVGGYNNMKFNGVTEEDLHTVEELLSYYNQCIKFTARDLFAKKLDDIDWGCKCHQCHMLYDIVYKTYSNINIPSGVAKNFRDFFNWIITETESFN